MAATMITDYRTVPCPRCMGQGYLAQFQHFKGGYCFQCGGSGEQVMPVERQMEYGELIEALATHGIIIEHISTDDWLHDLFGNPEVTAQMRLILAAL